MAKSVHTLIISLILSVILLLRIVQIGGLHTLSNSTDISSLSTPLTTVSDKITAIINQNFPSPQNALLSGILLGEKSDLPSDFKKALSQTSTIHIVVASGQNLSLVAGFFLGLSPFFGRKKMVFITMIVITIYTLLTGFQVPIIRAYIMALIVLTAQLFNRESSSSRSLFITALLMLIYNPIWLLSVSFQLSFLATFASLIVAPEISNRIAFLPSGFKEDLIVTFSAQLLTLPIIALNFHQISLIGVVVNSLVLWTVPFIMISGALTITALILVPLLGQVLLLIPTSLLTYFIYIITFFSRKWGVINVHDYSYLIWIGYYVLILGLFLIIRQKNMLIESEIVPSA